MSRVKRKAGARGQLSRIFRHPLSPFRKRGLVGILILVLVLLVGTFGLMLIEGWGFVDAFYFMALIATAEGPAATPATSAGKIFAAFMAFISIGAAISAITFTFGPLFGAILRIGARYAEKEELKLKNRFEHKDPSTLSSE